MLDSVSATLTPYLPFTRADFTRDRVAEAAQTALKQLPWVAGAALTTVIPMTYLLACDLAGLLVLVPIFFIYYYEDDAPKAAAQTLLLVAKIVLIFQATFMLGVAMNGTYLAATQFLQAPINLITLLISYKLSFRAKNDYETFDEAKWFPIVEKCIRGYIGNYTLIREAFVEAGFTTFIPYIKNVATGYELLQYLSDHDIDDKTKLMFPTIFESPNKDHFENLFFFLEYMPTAANKMEAYFKEVCATDTTPNDIKSWLASNPPYNTENLAKLHAYLRVWSEVEKRFENVSKIPLDEKSAAFVSTIPLSPFLTYYSEFNNLLLPLHTTLNSYLEQQLQNGSRLIYTLDRIGFSDEDYTQLATVLKCSSDRYSVMSALHRFALYREEDLVHYQILADGGAQVIRAHLIDFIQGKPLETATYTPNPSNPRYQLAIVVAVKAARIALRLIQTPFVTVAGLAWGYFRNSPLNLLRSVFRPTFWYHESRWLNLARECFATYMTLGDGYVRQSFAFFEAVSLGESIRNYRR